MDFITAAKARELTHKKELDIQQSFINDINKAINEAIDQGMYSVYTDSITFQPKCIDKSFLEKLCQKYTELGYDAEIKLCDGPYLYVSWEEKDD